MAYKKSYRKTKRKTFKKGKRRFKPIRQYKPSRGGIRL